MVDPASDRARDPLTDRDRILAAVVPVVLVLIAALSIFRYHDLRQSAWQGIGFGMFASYDTRVSRVVQVEIDEGGERRVVDASSVFGDLVERSRTIPLGPAPRELAERVRERIGADRVVVEVWDPDVEGGDGQVEISLDPIRRVEVP